MQTVYVDLYFFINFSMDLLCLYLTSRLLGEKLSLFRGTLAAALGGLYANLALFIGVGGIYGFLLDAVSLAIICIVGLAQRGRLKRIPLHILVFAAVSATLGGVMTALFYLFNRTGIFEFIKESDGDGISVWLFALLATISAVITLIGGRGATKKMSASEVELEITFGGRTAVVRGISDSGNLLRDPISGKPCIVADKKRLKKLIPPELSDLSPQNALSRLSGLKGDARKRIAIIPISTASGESLLVGLRAERIRIKKGREERDADAIVALSELEVGALVPSCLLI